MDGPLTVHGHDIQASGAVTFQQNVTIQSNLVITGGLIDIRGDVDGTGHSLSLLGTTILGNDTGDEVTGLTTLTISGTTISLGAGLVSSSGEQSYTGGMTLTGNAVLTAPSVVLIGGILGSGHSLTVNGNAEFNSGGSGTVSGVSSLTVNGQTLIDMASISTSGVQAFHGQVTLNQNATLTASEVQIDGDLIGGGRSLKILAG